MRRSLFLFPAVVLLGGQIAASSDDKAPPKNLADGVYAVQRDSLKEKEVLPLKEGEVLVVHRHRYVKKDENEPPRFLVVRSSGPDVVFDLAAAPKAVKEEGQSVRIQLTLKPKAAAALERLTRDHKGRQIAIILGGEVVTMHKIRAVIKEGNVEITSCAAGAAEYLLERLQGRREKK